MRTLRAKNARTISGLAALIAAALAAGCDGAQPVSSPPDGGADPFCSQMHRDFGRWLGAEQVECGPDLTDRLELTPLGNGYLLSRRRFRWADDGWHLTPEGSIDGSPVMVNQISGFATAGFTLLPGSDPLIFVSDPRLPSWNLYRPDRTALGVGGDILVSQVPYQPHSWPVGPSDDPTVKYWRGPDGAPWGHQFLGLEDRNLLDWDAGDGSTRVWRLTAQSDGAVQVVLRSELVAGANPALRRGHHLVYLGPTRLLEWIARPCPEDTASVGSCFHVWAYSVAEGAGSFVLTEVAHGFWPEIDAGHEIFGDGSHLFVWTRATGRLRSYALDPAAGDPLGFDTSGASLLTADTEDRTDDLAQKLKSQEWEPPTASRIKHLVLVLQNGRSFDSYFGQYCQGAGGAGDSSDTASTSCEPMPTVLHGLGCSPLDPAADPAPPAPRSDPECMRDKINGGAMDGFLDGPCGSPGSFTCAGIGSAAGAVALYHALAQGGALADRFFQTYAYLGGSPAAGSPTDGAAAAALPPAWQNLFYLATARFTPDPSLLLDSHLVTKELVQMQVPWAFYAGRTYLSLLSAVSVPRFYDPSWSPHRSLVGGELESDLANHQLPPVSVVLPDDDDLDRSEAPGHPFARGIAYVDELVRGKIGGSPYRDDTLILVAHLTAGGFYDHVRPPEPPPIEVDRSRPTLKGALLINYGPRTPLLALGRFAQAGRISQVPLEMASITRFIEWNWLYGAALNAVAVPSDIRTFRDTVVNNLGSLIDPVLACGPGATTCVPIGGE